MSFLVRPASSRGSCTPSSLPVQPRAEISLVVGVGPADHRFAAALARQGVQPAEQVALAVEAPVGRIGRIVRIGKLAGLHFDEPCPEPAGHPPAGRPLTLGQTRRDAHGRQDVVLAEGLDGKAQQKRAVHAARERDHHAVEGPQNLPASVQLALEFSAHLLLCFDAHRSAHSPGAARRLKASRGDSFAPAAGDRLSLVANIAYISVPGLPGRIAQRNPGKH